LPRKKYMTEEERAEAKKIQSRKASRLYRLKKKLEKTLKIKAEEKLEQEDEAEKIRLHELEYKAKVQDVVDHRRQLEKQGIKVLNCLYCGCIMGFEESSQDERCRFCRQYDSKKEAMVAREKAFNIQFRDKCSWC